MYPTRVISINPAQKTLGELHNPTVYQVCFGANEDVAVDNPPVQTRRSSGAVSSVGTLIARILMSAVVVWCSLTVTEGLVMYVMLCGAALMLAGFGSRIVALAEIMLAYMVVILVSATPLLATSLTFAFVITIMALPIVVIGSGRLSLDHYMSHRR